MRTLYKNIISFRKCMGKRSHNPQSPILCFIPADNAITWFLFELLAHNSRFSHITNPFQCLHNAHTIDFCWKSAIGSPICFGISEYQQKSGSLVFVQNSSLQFQILKKRGNEKKNWRYTKNRMSWKQWAHRVFKILCIYHWCVAFKDAGANLVGIWTEFGVEKLNASVTERAKECKYPANIYDMYWLNYSTYNNLLPFSNWILW